MRHRRPALHDFFGLTLKPPTIQQPTMHILHLIHRLDIGGLETVVAQLVNRLPVERFRHSVVSLTELTAFQNRFHHPHVTFHALHKQPGKDLLVWVRYWRLLRRLQPDLVHACNLATLEAAIPTRLAGVKRFVHAEHGRDSHDPDGTSPKYLLWRRFMTPWVDRFIPVSGELETWMQTTVSIPRPKILRIGNGVLLPDQPRDWMNRDPDHPFTIGFVGRLWPIKDPMNLVRAFHRLRQMAPDIPVRLLFVGDGPERATLELLIEQWHLHESIRMVGWQTDVAHHLRQLDLFVLPSKAEGTPLTLLEAMAMGVPVVATRVGGVADLVVEGVTGRLVPPNDPQALAAAMLGYLLDPATASLHGAAGRERVAAHFSLENTIAAYERLFLQLLVTKNQGS
ncbi:MAG: TIGR03088 family PEP-CTERM/XrtA system glycosyltransferase [Magnetococcales bacterium]|nr:TIGR03088 family PEP-CTERM/XrtA system glycosyltransferase [Magnetococcales bacterium]NGZ07153.1 TIGR03088 family PEP-CTERM/XrtA system glycosyltransferase [Magnetococcales bacterium]